MNRNVKICFFFCIVGEQQSEFSSFDKNDNRGQEAISKRLSVVSRVPFTEEQLFSIFDIFLKFTNLFKGISESGVVSGFFKCISYHLFKCHIIIS